MQSLWRKLSLNEKNLLYWVFFLEFADHHDCGTKNEFKKKIKSSSLPKKNKDSDLAA